MPRPAKDRSQATAAIRYRAESTILSRSGFSPPAAVDPQLPVTVGNNRPKAACRYRLKSTHYR